MTNWLKWPFLATMHAYSGSVELGNMRAAGEQLASVLDKQRSSGWQTLTQ